MIAVATFQQGNSNNYAFPVSELAHNFLSVLLLPTFSIPWEMLFHFSGFSNLIEFLFWRNLGIQIQQHHANWLAKRLNTIGWTSVWLLKRTLYERRRSCSVDDCRRRSRPHLVLFNRDHHKYLPQVEDWVGNRRTAVENWTTWDQRLLQQRHRLFAE